jgi:hypothetical protein
MLRRVLRSIVRTTHLQQLRADRECDRMRRLVSNAVHADRAGHLFHPRRVDAALDQPAFEFHALRLRSDHPEVREVAPSHDPRRKREVERVVVRHHEKVRAGRRAIDDRIGRVGRFDLHVRRHFVRKQFVAFVNPLHDARQLPEQRHERMADMASAEQHDMHRRRVAREAGGHHRGHPCVRAARTAPTALRIASPVAGAFSGGFTW